MAPLLAAHHRCQQLDLCAFFQRHHLIRHLVHGLAHDRPAAFRAVRDPGSRIQQPEIIIDLRHGSYCGTWVFIRRFLIDADRRAQPLDLVHIRLFHLPQELSCIRRKRLHIPPLSFRIDRIKCQGRLSRAGKPRKYYKLISRDRKIHILQVVFPRPHDPDRL